MPTLPKATTTVSDTAGALATGLDVIAVLAPVAMSADITPRLFGSAQAAYAQHGYSDGIEYVAVHADRTRKPVLFLGLPIVTPGVVGRLDTSGNTGSSVVSVTAGANGVLGEHDGAVTVVKGGTIGADTIMLGLSMDGSRTFVNVRLGQQSSYAIPYFGVSLAFAAGTLNTGDTIATWHGSAPRTDTPSIQAARAALAAGTRAFRSILLIGDLQTSTDALAYNTELDSYETANQRFVYGRASVRDRLPLANLGRTSARMAVGTSLVFASVGDTITRGSGSWIADGFNIGDTFTITGTGSNNLSGVITALTATVLTTAAVLANETNANATVTSTPSLVFASSGHTITRNVGSWIADGFRIGDSVTVAGTVSNNGPGHVITALSATVMTFGSGLVNETIGVSPTVSVSTGQTKAAWMADLDSSFALVDAHKRIDMSAGRGRITSPFSSWYMRRPAGWFASWREFTHDLHVATWRKSDGPVGADLTDANGTLVEWDDRVDGEAGTQARFTTLRTWGNGPQGGFIARSLTRATDGSILGDTHNMSVTNLACTIVQAYTENAIGRSMVLNPDGTATKDALNTLTSEVNAQLELGLLKNTLGEGQRASKAVWTPSGTDVLNVVDATITGVLELVLNGTIVKVNTTVRVHSGGQ